MTCDLSLAILQDQKDCRNNSSSITMKTITVVL
jgi:hypothetical protein